MPSFTAGMRELYGRRRDLVCDGLARLGLVHVEAARARLRVGADARRRRLGRPSPSACSSEAAVVVGPGRGLRPVGEGYVRLSLTVPDERLAEAMERIARAL